MVDLIGPFTGSSVKVKPGLADQTIVAFEREETEIGSEVLASAFAEVVKELHVAGEATVSGGAFKAALVADGGDGGDYGEEHDERQDTGAEWSLVGAVRHLFI